MKVLCFPFPHRLCFLQHLIHKPLPFGQESLHIFKELGDQHGITLAQKALAYYSALLQEKYPLAKQRYQSSLTLLRELNDTKEIIRCLNGLGYTCWRLGECQEAKQYHEESLLLSRTAGDKYGTAEALAHLGQDVYGMKAYKETEELFTASLEIYKEIGSPGALLVNWAIWQS